MGAARWWVAAVALGVAASAGFAMRPPAPAWHPVAWPFPRDAWPPGLAFECARATCGDVVHVYVRPKRGFCANCATGVTSDSEVDGVADLDMLADDFTPLAPGQFVAIGDMAGRRRAYTVMLPQGRRTPAVGIAMTRRKQCDLVVALAEGVVSDKAERAIETLLASTDVAPWIARQLDGR